MFTFVEVSKNTYPYRTLHVEGCGVLNRAKYQRTLDIEQVRRLDSVRIDYCTRCVGKTTIGVGGNTEYSAARTAFWAIQRSFKENEALAWQRIHAARKVASLRIALEEAEAECPKDVEFADILADTERSMRSGGLNTLEVSVQRR